MGLGRWLRRRRKKIRKRLKKVRRRLSPPKKVRAKLRKKLRPPKRVRRRLKLSKKLRRRLKPSKAIRRRLRISKKAKRRFRKVFKKVRPRKFRRRRPIPKKRARKITRKRPVIRRVPRKPIKFKVGKKLTARQRADAKRFVAKRNELKKRVLPKDTKHRKPKKKVRYAPIRPEVFIQRMDRRLTRVFEKEGLVAAPYTGTIEEVKSPTEIVCTEPMTEKHLDPNIFRRFKVEYPVKEKMKVKGIDWAEKDLIIGELEWKKSWLENRMKLIKQESNELAQLVASFFNINTHLSGSNDELKLISGNAVDTLQATQKKVSDALNRQIELDQELAKLKALHKDPHGCKPNEDTTKWPDLVPVYEFYNKYKRDYFYTTDFEFDTKPDAKRYLNIYVIPKMEKWLGREGTPTSVDAILRDQKPSNVGRYYFDGKWMGGDSFKGKKDNFGVVLEGYIRFPRPGLYNFQTYINDFFYMQITGGAGDYATNDQGRMNEYLKKGKAGQNNGYDGKIMHVSSKWGHSSGVAGYIYIKPGSKTLQRPFRIVCGDLTGTTDIGVECQYAYAEEDSGGQARDMTWFGKKNDTASKWFSTWFSQDGHSCYEYKRVAFGALDAVQTEHLGFPAKIIKNFHTGWPALPSAGYHYFGVKDKDKDLLDSQRYIYNASYFNETTEKGEFAVLDKELNAPHPEGGKSLPIQLYKTHPRLHRYYFRIEDDGRTRQARTSEGVGLFDSKKVKVDEDENGQPIFEMKQFPRMEKRPVRIGSEHIPKGWSWHGVQFHAFEPPTIPANEPPEVYIKGNKNLRTSITKWLHFYKKLELKVDAKDPDGKLLPDNIIWTIKEQETQIAGLKELPAGTVIGKGKSIKFEFPIGYTNIEVKVRDRRGAQDLDEMQVIVDPPSSRYFKNMPRANWDRRYGKDFTYGYTYKRKKRWRWRTRSGEYAGHHWGYESYKIGLNDGKQESKRLTRSEFERERISGPGYTGRVGGFNTTRVISGWNTRRRSTSRLPAAQFIDRMYRAYSTGYDHGTYPYYLQLEALPKEIKIPAKYGRRRGFLRLGRKRVVISKAKTKYVKQSWPGLSEGAPKKRIRTVVPDFERILPPKPPKKKKKKKKKIICNELYNQGFLPQHIWDADERWGDMMYKKDPRLVLGYMMWARHIVKFMKEKPQYTKYIYLLCRPWTEFMAHQIGVLNKRNRVGEFIHWIGSKYCYYTYDKAMKNRKTYGLNNG